MGCVPPHAEADACPALALDHDAIGLTLKFKTKERKALMSASFGTMRILHDQLDRRQSELDLFPIGLWRNIGKFPSTLMKKRLDLVIREEIMHKKMCCLVDHAVQFVECIRLLSQMCALVRG
jgi:hypothetical protein